MLYVAGDGQPLEADEVKAHWLPSDATRDDAAMLGLRLAKKPAILEAVDLGIEHLLSGLSWASWLNAEKRRSQPEFGHRVRAMETVCLDGVGSDIRALESLEATVAAENRPEMRRLCTQVRSWLRNCSDVLREHIFAAQSGTADDGLLQVLGNLLKMQPFDAGELPSDHADLMSGFLGLRATIPSRCYGC